jgi:hypothetical protein
MAISQIVTNSIANGAVTAADIASGQTFSLSGITFPATQVPSANANTLDDYEEGTWTPVLGGFSSVTYSERLGSYIKIGRMVYAFWDMTISSKSGSGNSTITGLPFTVSSSMAGYSVINHRSSDLFNSNGVTYGQLKGFAEKAATYMFLQVDLSTTGSYGYGNTVGYNATGRSTGYIIYEANA